MTQADDRPGVSTPTCEERIEALGDLLQWRPSGEIHDELT